MVSAAPSFPRNLCPGCPHAPVLPSGHSGPVAVPYRFGPCLPRERLSRGLEVTMKPGRRKRPFAGNRFFWG